MPVKLYVEGDYACFTRPEMKVERVSYDVMTPSAARGILEAVYWKPQISWVVDRIHVLRPVRFTNLRRNEVSERAARPSHAQMNGEPSKSLGLLVEDHRQQRASLLLRDVAYLIEAHFEVLDTRFEPDGPEQSASACEGKHLDMFNRRARKGQCFHQPYFGTREFPAAFSLYEAATPPESELPFEDGNRDLGWMLHDIAFLPATKKDADSFVDGRGHRLRAEPRFFNAKLQDGILHVPPFQHAKA
ncbi:MAG: type I-C CRISPR-associated protein Cas5c [Opitutales bacterium]